MGDRRECAKFEKCCNGLGVVNPFGEASGGRGKIDGSGLEEGGGKLE